MVRLLATLALAVVALVGSGQPAQAGTWGPYTAYDGVPSGGVFRECVFFTLGDNTGGFAVNPRGGTTVAKYGSSCGFDSPRLAGFLYARATIRSGLSGAICSSVTTLNAGGTHYAITPSASTAPCSPTARRISGEGQYRHPGAGWTGSCPGGPFSAPPCTASPSFPI
jgi:hypothetical protein